MSAYDFLAVYYDAFQKDLDPSEWADFVDQVAKRYAKKSGDGENGKLLLCDLGCGTGLVTTELSKRGYDTIGVDNSPCMLDQARKNAGTRSKILWLLQDMTKLDLFGSADIFVSLLDTVNHISDRKALEKMFASFSNFLNPGGLFIFDVATKKHFEETLSDNFFYLVEDDFTVLWENDYDPKKKLNTASLTMFGTEDGVTYSRCDEDIVERYYSDEEIREIVTKYGLEVAGVFGDLKKRKPNDKDERIFYCVRRPMDVLSSSEKESKKRR